MCHSKLKRFLRKQRATRQRQSLLICLIVRTADLKHFLTYDLIESEPAATVMSAIHTIRLRRVTAVCFDLGGVPGAINPPKPMLRLPSI